MTNLDDILAYFKVKSHFILYKHSAVSPFAARQFSYIGMSSFYGNMNNKMKEVDDELSEVTVDILQKYQYEEDVDFDDLMEGLYNYKKIARQQFLQMHQTC